MKYSEKLRDPRWQKKRLEIMERDEFTCQGCGDAKSTLNVHHLRYIKNKEVWDYDNLILVTLCEPCHNINHEFYDEEFNSLKEFAQSHGFTYNDLDIIADMIKLFSTKIIEYRKSRVKEYQKIFGKVHNE